MANTGAKLSSFPEVNDIQTGDMFPLLSGGNTNAKIDYATLANAIIAKEVERATAAENKLESEKADKTTATSSADGLMSKADKAKLDGIGTGSNVKSVNGKTGAVTLAKSDVGLSSVANLDQSKAIKSITRSGTTFTATALDGTTTTFTQQDSNTTYGVATSSTDGLMSKTDKAKLDGISSGADAVNAVQNNLDNEINARTSADTLINTRIDEIIAPSGQAPSAAEVQDIRVKADGTSAATAGNAVREQIVALINNHQTGSRDSSGNIILKYPMLVGHTYVYKNTSENSCTHVVHTSSANSSSDTYHIELVTYNNFNKGNEVVFSPTRDGQYLHIYMNAAGSFELYEETSILPIYRRVIDNDTLYKEHDLYNTQMTANVGSLQESIEIPLYWERGSVNTNTGADNNENWRSIRSRYFKVYKGQTIIVKIPDESVASSGFAIKYDINKVFSLTYNITNNAREIHVNSDCYFRFLAYSSSDVIPLVDDEIYKQISINLKNKIVESFNPLPSYYTDEWKANIIEKVQDSMAVKTGGTFAFITDMHVQHNAMNSGKILKLLADNTSIPFVVYGGDTPYAYGDKTTVREAVKAWNKFANETTLPIYYVKGNHDFTIKTSASDSTGWTEFNSFSRGQIMGKTSMRVVADKGSCSYYFDDETEKIRYVVIDAWAENLADNNNDNNIAYGVGASLGEDSAVSTYDFLIRAFSVNEYSIIVFMHHAPDRVLITTVGTEAIHEFLRAFKQKTRKIYGTRSGTILYNVDFSDNTSELVAVITGHRHKDQSNVLDGVLSIITTCDTYDDSDEDVVRQKGTVTEQAFDVFTVDTTNKIIKAVRVGGGNDRAWNYATGEILY